jgi:hypothetical protein
LPLSIFVNSERLVRVDNLETWCLCEIR